MKFRLYLWAAFLLILPLSMSYSQTIPVESMYLGQTVPDFVPKIFELSVSPGYSAADRIAISPDGKEIYFSETVDWSFCRIKYYSYNDNKWNGPDDLFDYLGPALSVTGDTLFFEDYADNLSSWYSVKTGLNWNKPVPAAFLKNPANKHYTQMTNNGNYYTSSAASAGGLGKLDISKRIVKSSDTSFCSLGVPLNSSGNEAGFFISRDEFFIIFVSSQREGFGSTDLFVSYAKKDSTWTNPKNLGPQINTSNSEFGPYVTANNKYLFLSRWSVGLHDGSIFWVRIDSLLDSLRHTNFIPYLKTQIPDQTDTAGYPFNFQIPESTFIDDDGNGTLTYSAELIEGNPLPEWLSFNAATRAFSGNSAAACKYSIKLTAADTAHASASCTFTINVVSAAGIKRE